MRRGSRVEVYMVGILVTFFVFCFNVEGTNWNKVGEAKGETQTFVDTDSIRREGNMVGAWARELPAIPQIVGDEKLVEVTSHNEFRCAHNQFRRTEVIYSYQSGKTERLASEGMKSWQTIIREPTRIMYEYLCKQRR
ncbi:MAG: surface-adhesin E family protein [Thermodesulfovibrionales bacterium]|jgi:hypothetical protein